MSVSRYLWVVFFVLSVTASAMQNVSANIKDEKTQLKDFVLWMIPRIDVKLRVEFFRSLDISMRADDDILMACAHGFLLPDEKREIQPETMLLVQLLVKRLCGADEIEKQRAKLFIEGLDSVQAEQLLKGAVGNEERRLTIYNCLCPSQNTQCKSDLNANKTVKQEWKSKFAAAVMGASLAYACFKWKNWGDIKRLNVCIPLVVAFGLSKYVSLVDQENALSYGPTIGILARFVAQSRAHGGMHKFAKRSYRTAASDPVNGCIAAIGTIAGFFTGVFDLSCLTVLSPIVTMLKQTMKKSEGVKKTDTTDSFKNPKTLAKVSCYLTRTVISRWYSPLVFGAEYMGRFLRSAAVNLGFMHNDPQTLNSVLYPQGCSNTSPVGKA